MELNTERIINTEEKEISRCYNELKANYSVDNAKAYIDRFTNMPVSKILKYFRYIFAEPAYGTQFASNVIMGVIPLYENARVLKMISEYITKYGKSLDATAFATISALYKSMEIKCESLSNSIKCGSMYSITNTDEDQVSMMYDDIEMNGVIGHRSTFADEFYFNLFKSPVKVDELIGFIHNDDIAIYGSMLADMLRDAPILKQLGTLSDATNDAVYRAAGYNSEKIIHTNATVYAPKPDGCIMPKAYLYSMVTDSLNKDELSTDEDDMIKKDHLESEIEVLESEMEILMKKALTGDFSSDDTLTDDDKSLIAQIGTTTEQYKDAVAELSILTERELSKAPKMISKRLEQDARPEQVSVARKIQTSAMDGNIQRNKKIAEGQQKFQEVKNATKAVMDTPEKITGAVKKQIEEWDDADDERRKEYIAKPGFRKTYFRALKLAIMHGLAFQISPIINIIIAIGTKLGGEKNKRMRQELIQDLETEISVLNEKINDASQEGNREAKYKLMRMRDKLVQEKTRVFSNSRVI